MGRRGVNDGFLIYNDLNDELVFLDKKRLLLTWAYSLLWHRGVFRNGMVFPAYCFTTVIIEEDIQYRRYTCRRIIRL